MKTPRPLVIRFGAFGDMVMALPLLDGLRRRYGQPCDLLGSGPWNPPLFGDGERIRELRTLKSRKAPYWTSAEQRQLVRQLREEAPRPIYLCDPVAKTHWLLEHAGLDPATWVSVLEMPRREGEHTVQHWRRMVDATPAAFSGVASLDAPTTVDIDRPDGADDGHRHGDANASDRPHLDPPSSQRPFKPRLRVHADAAKEVRGWLSDKGWHDRPLVLVQPGNKKTMKGGRRRRASNVKYWPESHWAAVIDGVERCAPGARVLLMGVPSETAVCRDIAERCRHPRVELATTDLPIPRLLALLGEARLTVSVDTGPAHAAAAIGCPLAVLFGRTDPRAFRPVATVAPVEVVTPGARSIDDWSPGDPEPEAVIDACQRLLQRGDRSGPTAT